MEKHHNNQQNKNMDSTNASNSYPVKTINSQTTDSLVSVDDDNITRPRAESLPSYQQELREAATHLELDPDETLSYRHRRYRALTAAVARSHNKDNHEPLNVAFTSVLDENAEVLPITGDDDGETRFSKEMFIDFKALLARVKESGNAERVIAGSSRDNVVAFLDQLTARVGAGRGMDLSSGNASPSGRGAAMITPPLPPAPSGNTRLGQWQYQLAAAGGAGHGRALSWPHLQQQQQQQHEQQMRHHQQQQMGQNLAAELRNVFVSQAQTQDQSPQQGQERHQQRLVFGSQEGPLVVGQIPPPNTPESVNAGHQKKKSSSSKSLSPNAPEFVPASAMSAVPDPRLQMNQMFIPVELSQLPGEQGPHTTGLQAPPAAAPRYGYGPQRFGAAEIARGLVNENLQPNYSGGTAAHQQNQNQGSEQYPQTGAMENIGLMKGNGHAYPMPATPRMRNGQNTASSAYSIGSQSSGFQYSPFSIPESLNGSPLDRMNKASRTGTGVSPTTTSHTHQSPAACSTPSRPAQHSNGFASSPMTVANADPGLTEAQALAWARIYRPTVPLGTTTTKQGLVLPPPNFSTPRGILSSYNIPTKDGSSSTLLVSTLRGPRERDAFTDHLVPVIQNRIKMREHAEEEEMAKRGLRGLVETSLPDFWPDGGAQELQQRMKKKKKNMRSGGEEQGKVIAPIGAERKMRMNSAASSIQASPESVMQRRFGFTFDSIARYEQQQQQQRARQSFSSAQSIDETPPIPINSAYNTYIATTTDPTTNPALAAWSQHQHARVLRRQMEQISSNATADSPYLCSPAWPEFPQGWIQQREKMKRVGRVRRVAVEDLTPGMGKVHGGMEELERVAGGGGAAAVMKGIVSGVDGMQGVWGFEKRWG